MNRPLLFSTAALYALGVLLLAAAGCSPTPSGGRDVLAFAPGEISSTIEIEILSDGEVSFAEFERAALTFVKCMEDRLAIRGGATYSDEGRTFVFDFRDATGGMNQKMLSQDAADCEAEIDSVQMHWADQQFEIAGRSDYDDVASCLRERGIEVASSEPEVLGRAHEQAPEEYKECYYEVFGGRHR